jgi:hypothetical protein
MKTITLLSICMAIAAVHPLWADAPGQLNYQGRLTDANGDPLNVPQNMVFKVFDAPSLGSIVAGGTFPPSGSLSVPVANGIFNVILNFPSSVFQSGVDRHLQVEVGGVALTPRVKLLASPYALAVAKDSVTSLEVKDGTLVDADVHDVSANKVTGGILSGTQYSIQNNATSPTSKLNINSNQIWKDPATGLSPTFFLQYSNPNGTVTVGDITDATHNNHLTVDGDIISNGHIFEGAAPVVTETDQPSGRMTGSWTATTGPIIPVGLATWTQVDMTAVSPTGPSAVPADLTTNKFTIPITGTYVIAAKLATRNPTANTPATRTWFGIRLGATIPASSIFSTNDIDSHALALTEIFRLSAGATVDLVALSNPAPSEITVAIISIARIGP